MKEFLARSELFEGLDERVVARVADLARPRSLRAGEYLFLLGDDADRVFVVKSGRVDTCFPLKLRGTMKDVTVESKLPGASLGWSALVKPHRFTMSARAAEPSEVVYFLRRELLERLDEEPEIGIEFSRRVAEVIGGRLLKLQALWGRELQRSIENGMAGVVIGDDALGVKVKPIDHESAGARARD